LVLHRNFSSASVFQREAQAASTLNHPQLSAPSTTSGEQDGQACIIMEFLDGRTLKHPIGVSPAVISLRTFEATPVGARG
jgi:hypothetical protein